MALDALRCNHLAPLGFKGLKYIGSCVHVILIQERKFYSKQKDQQI